jgi:hypothetical protein
MIITPFLTYTFPHSFPVTNAFLYYCKENMLSYTDKKENQIFLIYEYKEILNGAVSKSYMTNGLLIYGEIFAHFLIYQEALPQT